MKPYSRPKRTQTTQTSTRVVEVPLELRSVGPKVTTVQPVRGGLCLPKGQIIHFTATGIRSSAESAADHERSTRSHPENLKYVTEAWAAQDFRKANVLSISATCCDDADLAAGMRQKAHELVNTAWGDPLYILQQTSDRQLVFLPDGKRTVECLPWYTSKSSNIACGRSM